uniref:AAA_12 domain-containing protein n=1 Tax=Strongyloides papillosus TaxID=174720 RepID=A0A0N5C2L8_STREA
MTNVRLYTNPDEPTILKIRGYVLFNSLDQIKPSSLITMGYNAGNPCKISFLNRSVQRNNPYLFDHNETIHSVSGYMTFAKPYNINNNVCTGVDVTVDVPYDDNDDINKLSFYMRSLYKTSSIEFKCIPSGITPFIDQDDAVEKLRYFWRSNISIPLLSFLKENYSSDITFRQMSYSGNLLYDETLDECQRDLANSICSGTKLITCLAPAGCGKTQSICSALLTGVAQGKKYLVVGPTNKSCEAILDRLFTWDPDTKAVLSLKSRCAMVRYPDKYNRSDIYYYRQGLDLITSQMTHDDRRLLDNYKRYKADYGSLKNSPPTVLDKDYFNRLNNAKSRLKNAETLLPELIMTYIKPKIIVCTIDLLVVGIPKAYTQCGFDNIIVDEASQVRCSTAILLLNLFPDSRICYLGDMNQLPPYALYKVTLDEKELLLSRPILQYMKDSEHGKTILLKYNYRSHPQLVKFVSDLFYDGSQYPKKNLQDCDTEMISFKTDEDDTNQQIYPYYLFNINYPSNQHPSGSTYNRGEAMCIGLVLLFLHSINYDPDEVVVISMYKAQVNTIHRKMVEIFDDYQSYMNADDSLKQQMEDFKYTLDNYRNKIVIDTVDGFQGHEKNIVLISTTRSTANPEDAKTEFYELKNRICVALTRPKIGFFLFGDVTLMKQCDTWGKVASRMENENTVLTFDHTNLLNIFQNHGPPADFFKNQLHRLSDKK